LRRAARYRGSPGFILHPAKLTRVETFRIGCVGAIDPADMRRALSAIAGYFACFFGIFAPDLRA